MPKELTSIGRCEKRKGPDHVSETPAKKQKPSVSPSSVQAEIINKSYNVNPFSTNEQFLPHSQYTPSDLDWSIPSNPDTIVETFHSNVGLQRYGLPSNLPKTNRRFSSTMLPESFPGCSGRPWHAHDIPVTPHLLSAEVNGKPLSLPPLQCLWDKNPNNPDPIGPNTGDILPWQEVATTDNDSAEISRRTEWNTTTTDHMFDNVHDLDMNPDGWLVEEGTTDRHLTPSDFPSHNSPYANSNISCTNSSQTPVASIEQSSTETPTPSATGECANHDIEMTDAQTIAADSSQNTNSVSYEVCFGMIHAATMNDLSGKLKSSEDGRSKISLTFSGDIGMINSSSQNNIGLLQSRTGKSLSTLARNYAGSVHLDSFAMVGAVKTKSPMKTVYILVYGFRKDLEEIGDFLSQNELFLQHPSFFDPAVHYDNPHYLLSPGKEIEIPDQAHLGSQGQAGERKSTSNVVNEISDIFETAGGPTHYYYRVAVDHIPNSNTRNSHQKKALAMMIEKESGKIEDNEFGSLWEVIRETGQGTRYRNVVTGKTSKDKPVVCHGGLLADAMGLGKSLTTLALIVGSIDYPSSVGQVSANRPTLIVAPKSTLSGWQEQIDRHLYPDSLRVYTYHGSQREKDTSKLSSYDIVLTTYGTLSAESAKDKRGSTQTAALHSIEWFRIVLDEAHFIRDKSTKQSQAACTLNSRYRWCLTGTPVQNRIDDFAALLRFLRVKPFDKPATFNSCIVNLLRRGDLSGVRKLRLLVNAVSLRRTKGLLTSEIQLPLREDRVEQIDFTDEERQLYQLIRDQSDSMLNAYEKEKSTKYCCTVLQIILRLRQICNHGPDLLPEKFKTSLEKCQASGELAMVSGDECEACGKEIKPEASVEVLVPSCLHILCAKCKGGGKAVKASSSGGNDASHCPLCFPAESDVPDKQTTTPLRQRTKVTKEYKPSSKVQALIANLRRDREEYYNVKSVIFTGWTQMLDLVEQALDAEGIGFQRLDGSTTLQQRNKRIGSFRNDDDCTVLLATIGTAGVGLDLTAASRVHLLEPQWNPLIEEQALDRIHRMGQTKNVVTYRYIVKDSIDEYVTAFQKKKLQLVNISFGMDGQGTSRADHLKDRLAELRSLLR